MTEDRDAKERTPKDETSRQNTCAIAHAVSSLVLFGISAVSCLAFLSAVS